MDAPTKTATVSCRPILNIDKKGELIGFEVDVAKQIAEGMGVELQLIPTQFAGIIPALLVGTFDTITTGIATTPKRNLQVNFTIPYQTYGSTITISRKALPGVTSLADLNKPNVALATRRGGTGVEAIKAIFPNVKIIQYDDDVQAFQDVINGNASAISAPKPKPEFYTKSYGDSLYQVPLFGSWMERFSIVVSLSARVILTS